METYTSIKCGLRARIEGLEMLLDMYEKDNPMRHNMMIRIDECNRLMRILTILENDKENENDNTEIARLKEKVKKLEVSLNYTNSHLEAERNYRERLEYEIAKQSIDYAFYKEKYEKSKHILSRNRALERRLSEQREITKKLLDMLHRKDG